MMGGRENLEDEGLDRDGGGEMTADDLLKFLSQVEDPEETEMNSRTTLTIDECEPLKHKYVGIPEEYLIFMQKIGHGALRECSACIYPEPCSPEDLMGAGVFCLGSYDAGQYLAIGDDFSGDLFAFDSDNWSIYRLSHVSVGISKIGSSFLDFIATIVGMSGSGGDLFV